MAVSGFETLGDIFSNQPEPNTVYNYESGMPAPTGGTSTDIRDVFGGDVQPTDTGAIPPIPPAPQVSSAPAVGANKDRSPDVDVFGTPVQPPSLPPVPPTPSVTTPGSPTVNVTPPPDQNLNPSNPFAGSGLGGGGGFEIDPEGGDNPPRTIDDPRLGDPFSGSGGGGGTTAGTTPFNPSSLNFPLFPLLGGNQDRLQEALLALAFQSGSFDLGTKSALFSSMFPQLQEMLKGTEGFSPEALAAMRGQAIEGTGQQFNATEEALRRSLSSRGLRTGNAPVSGLAGREFSDLGAARAATTSGALRDVTTKNESQRLQNLFNAFNIASGFPSNPAASIGAGASIPQQQGGFWSRLGGSIAGTGLSALGKALGEAIIKRIPGLGGGGGGSPSTGGTPPFIGGGGGFDIFDFPHS